jgi:hypothetical protein
VTTLFVVSHYLIKDILLMLLSIIITSYLIPLLVILQLCITSSLSTT